MFKRIRDFFFVPYDKPKCETCETLREALSYERHEKEKLLRYILEPEPKIIQEAPVMEEPEPVGPRIIPWEVRRRMLEAEDRKQAELIREQKKNTQKAIEELEGRLGVKPLDLGGKGNDESSTVETGSGQAQQEEVKARG